MSQIYVRSEAGILVEAQPTLSCLLLSTVTGALTVPFTVMFVPKVVSSHTNAHTQTHMVPGDTLL